MNRLRGRKKCAEEEHTAEFSTKTDFSFPFKMLSRFKKPTKDSEPVMEATPSLPSDDEFRTSLVMTELSARFSLLRERESPSKKNQEASDDSVLYYGKHSRMTPSKESNRHENDKGSPKRPSTRSGRIDVSKKGEKESKNEESMVNRGRATESNTLLGGRHIFNVVPSSGSCGRALYCEDIAPSTFQRWRQSEKERNGAEENESGDTWECLAATFHQSRSSAITTGGCREHSLRPEQDLNQNHSRPHRDTSPTSVQNTSLDGPPEEGSSITVQTKASAPDLRSCLPVDPGSPPSVPVKSSQTVLEANETTPSFLPPPLGTIVKKSRHDSLRVKKPNKATGLALQPRPSVKYDEEKYVRRQSQIQRSRKTTTNPRYRVEPSKNQIKRRSRPFLALNHAEVDKTPSTVVSKGTSDKETLPRTYGNDTGKETQNMAELSPLGFRQRPGLSAAAAPVIDHGSSPPGHPAISPLHISTQTHVNSVWKRGITSNGLHQPEPRAILGSLDNKLSRDTSTTPSNNNPGTQESSGPFHQEYKAKTTILDVSSDSWKINDSEWDHMFAPTPFEITTPANTPKPAANNPRGSEDFARHLSDGAKRIREKMTMYAQPDHSRPPSSELPSVDGSDLPPARSGVFNILRSKTSSGTLAGRRLLSGSSTSSVALSTPYESFSKSMAHDPKSPKSAATQSFSRACDET